MLKFFNKKQARRACFYLWNIPYYATLDSHVATFVAPLNDIRKNAIRVWVSHRIVIARNEVTWQSSRRRTHQASDIAQLWQEFLSLFELIACIGCLVKSNKASVAVDNEHVRCLCHSDDFCDYHFT